MNKSQQKRICTQSECIVKEILEEENKKLRRKLREEHNNLINFKDDIIYLKAELQRRHEVVDELRKEIKKNK